MISELVALVVGFAFLVTAVLLIVAIAEVVDRMSEAQIDWFLIISGALAVSYVCGKIILTVGRMEGIL